VRLWLKLNSSLLFSSNIYFPTFEAPQNYQPMLKSFTPATTSFARCLIILLTVTIGCNNKNDRAVTYIDPSFGEYISSYTAGVVSSGASFRILFAKDAMPANTMP